MENLKEQQNALKNENFEYKEKNYSLSEKLLECENQIFSLQTEPIQHKKYINKYKEIIENNL